MEADNQQASATARSSHAGVVPVFIASAGAPWLVELAVLSARRRSSIPVRFVIGDSLGNVGPTVDRLRRGGLVELQTCLGRQHAEWLDLWVAGCTDTYAVFLDSDVFMRRSCWLSPLIGALDDGAALVSCCVSERLENSIDPVSGAITTEMPRPCPWVMAVDCATVRAVGASFAYATRTESGKNLRYDVGGIVVERLRSAQELVEALPASYQSYYCHIQNMSWRPLPSARTEPRRWLRLLNARTHLAVEKVARRDSDTQWSSSSLS